MLYPQQNSARLCTAQGGLWDFCLSHDLSANDIVTESSLVRRFSVSKAPVREALIELCKDGFLKSLPRFGYQVVQCSVQEIMEMLDVREDLEIGNLKRCFPYLAADSLSIFRENEDEWAKDNDSNSDIYGNYYRNQRFHLMLCSLSGNRYMYRALDTVLRDSARFFATYYSSAWDNERESKGKYHHMILDALGAGNQYKLRPTGEADSAPLCQTPVSD